MAEETIHRHVNDRPDSIEIGTPSKGGAVKIYFNAMAPEEETRRLIDAALRARSYADAMGGPAMKPQQEGKP